MAIMKKLRKGMGQVGNAIRPQMGAPAGGIPADSNRPAGPPPGLMGIPAGLQNIQNIRDRIGNRGIGARVPGFTPSNAPMPQPLPTQQPMPMQQPQMPMGMPMGMQQPGMQQPMGMPPQMGGMFGGYRNIAANQQSMNQARPRNRFSGFGGQEMLPPAYGE